MWQKPIIQYNACTMQTEFLTSGEPGLATVAAFFRIGLMARVCTPDEARAWALSIIAASDDPPGEIIEVSWRKPLDVLLADLSSVAGEVDSVVVGHWLLARVAELPAVSEDEIWDRSQQAMQISRVAGLHELFDDFNGLDDEFNLAVSGVCGDVASCREEFLSILATFSKAPFNFR